MKNIQLIIFCTLLGLTTTIAQENQEENTAREKVVKTIHYGISITPKYSHLIFDHNEIGESNDKINFSLGVDMYFELNEKIQITAGLNYSNINISIIDYTPQFKCDHVGNGSVDPHGSYFDHQINSHFIGLHAGAKLFIPNTFQQWFITGGMEFLAKLADDHDIAVVECGQETFLVDPMPLEKIKKGLFKANIGFGYQFDYSPTKQIVINPQVEYTIGKVLTNGGLLRDVSNNFNLLDFGLKIGLIF